MRANRLAGLPVRACGRFAIKVQEKFKLATILRIPLKPFLFIPRITGSALVIFSAI